MTYSSFCNQAFQKFFKKVEETFTEKPTLTHPNLLLLNLVSSAKYSKLFERKRPGSRYYSWKKNPNNCSSKPEGILKIGAFHLIP